MKQKNKKVVIVGAGLAGLTAALYAQMNGFETEIYESHFRAGGMCTTWMRNGYKIDNCVHWFSCTKENMQMRKIWETVGFVGEDIPKSGHKKFCESELNGQKISLWSDVERTRKEMLELSPEDADQINDFIETVKLERGMQLPTFKPITAVGLFDLPKMLKTMSPMLKAIRHVGKESIGEYANRFKHPLLQQVLKDMIPTKQYATSFMASYGTIISGNGDFTYGGSDTMLENLIGRYEKFGGKIHLKAKVEKTILENGRGNKKQVKSIVLADGSEVSADYFIFATDPYITFRDFLDAKYMPKGLKTRYENKKGNPTFTAFQCAIAVDGIFDDIESEYFFDLPKTITCGVTEYNRMNLKNFHEYGPGFAPEGKDIIQVHLKMFEKDWEYWYNLRNSNPEEYKAQKLKAGQEILESIEEHFPKYKGKLSLLDVWTPATYTHYTGAYTGSYMTFIKTEESGANYIPNTIKGISNALLASNWLMSPGGIPCAVAEGYFAWWYLNKISK